MENTEAFSLHFSGCQQWDYYVTMPMPASTFTIAVGQWLEAGVTNFVDNKLKYVVHVTYYLLLSY